MFKQQTNVVATVPFALVDQAGAGLNATAPLVFTVTPALCTVVPSPDGKHLIITPTGALGTAEITHAKHAGSLTIEFVAPGELATAHFGEAAVTFAPKAH